MYKEIKSKKIKSTINFNFKTLASKIPTTDAAIFSTS